MVREAENGMAKTLRDRSLRAAEPAMGASARIKRVAEAECR
jgi:hypothetical protein